ncbi:hypothetical protein ACFYZB_27795 [Streptomyces sp. NPDC001852]|uniref:hypothetical protein n=1 Tax=Streptomyces sp. NPDC001852 TaxID=3364619 RepID=UPI0036A25FFA
MEKKAGKKADGADGAVDAPAVGPGGLQALLTAPALRRRRRRALRFLALCVIVLVPWTVYLALSLPDRFQARYWPAAWVGFDVLLLLSLLGAGLAVWLHRQILIPCAVVAATLLVCDAWFDVSLAWGTPDIWESVASAVLIELPLAGLLLVRAHRLLRATVRLAWQRLGLPGEPPPVHRLPLFGTPASGGTEENAPGPPG